MAGRDIQIPFGPDRTNGVGISPVDEPEQGEGLNGFYAEPTTSGVAALEAEVPEVMPAAARPSRRATVSGTGAMPGSGQEPMTISGSGFGSGAASGTAPTTASAADGESTADGEASADDGVDYHPGGLTEEEAARQGMDEFQMSILALKDSIGQGRELKEREKEREELTEALEADHIELADRENILANFDALAAEQDSFIARHSQQREARKEELSKATVAMQRAQAELDALKEQHAAELQPIEEELGRARAAADQAKNDERSRKTELNAAESGLRRSDDADANNTAVAQHQQVKAAYDEARARSDQAKERLAQVQRAYDDAKQRVEQAEGPIKRSLEDLSRHVEELKQDINQLGEEISSAHNRRQYLDTVHQYPDETARMRSEVEAAEAAARQMDAENEALRGQLAESKRKARMAKVAIGILIAIIIVFIVTFVIVSGR